MVHLAQLLVVVTSFSQPAHVWQ